MNNKLFKRTGTILLALIMMFSFAACGSGNDDDNSDNSGSADKKAYELYTSAAKAMNEADSIEMDMNTTMSMEAEGESMDTVMEGNIKQINKSKTDIEMSMDMKTETMGQKTDMMAYYKGGEYYVNMGGQKMKMDMDIDQIKSTMSANSVDIPEDAVKESSVKESSEGTELNFKLDGTKMTDMASGLMGGMGDSSGADMKMGDITMKVIIGEDDNIKLMDMKFDMDISAEEQTITTKCDLVMDIIKIGGVEIEWPDDLDEYTAQ